MDIKFPNDFGGIRTGEFQVSVELDELNAEIAELSHQLGLRYAIRELFLKSVSAQEEVLELKKMSDGEIQEVTLNETVNRVRNNLHAMDNLNKTKKTLEEVDNNGST